MSDDAHTKALATLRGMMIGLDAETLEEAARFMARGCSAWPAIDRAMIEVRRRKLLAMMNDKGGAAS